MTNLILFLNSFLSYFLLFLFVVVLVIVAVIIGKKWSDSAAKKNIEKLEENKQ